ncbi:hypothetical protein JX265_004857 [Neoarthrinium moseri]|uniref:CBM1 domain-containing protein n=1 Tax=Neoarthrinium moseri TaxID=1658444 RepID=A0A9P9WQD8_9PEZI|nr:hypothetical protein JX266_007108 [Neoarthrinium moseri]KAI1874649.1 hypothetical protein JX265_004857 [Neoarthrinium moseri]
MLPYIIACIVLTSTVAAQQPAWAQCGGQGHTGDVSCISGCTCVSLNDYYSQCQASSTTLSTVTVTTAHTAPAATSSTVTIAGEFQYLGRVNPATRELSWPGAGLAFNFTGTSASISISAVSGSVSADLSIDGAEPIVIPNVEGTSISTPQGLTLGVHTVVLRKRSEPEYGSVIIGNVTVDGILGAYAVPTRRIEIIGDSISVGYGLDGTNPCTNNASVENNPKTYGALAAKALGAEYSTVAWSGKGLVRNIAIGAPDTSPLMPELYTRYGANDADSSYTFPAATAPNAVVINLGTNDFSYIAYTSSGEPYNAREPINASTFTAGMVSFVQNIQTHYPDAHFFLLNSPMLSDYWPTAADAQKSTQTSAIKAAITQLGGSNIHFVDWPTQGSDVGCDYHPNADTHAAEGTVLAEAIGTALNW